MAEEQLSWFVDDTINKRLLGYDLVCVVGPVFPHEVVGFSGGIRRFFGLQGTANYHMY